MLNFCEVCAAICCDCDLWDTKRFSVFWKKRARLKTKKYNNDFRKVVISDSIPDALRDLHTSKYKRPRNKPEYCCLKKPAKRNNVRTSKQLWYFASTEKFNGNQVLVCYAERSEARWLTLLLVAFRNHDTVSQAATSTSRWGGGGLRLALKQHLFDLIHFIYLWLSADNQHLAPRLAVVLLRRWLQHLSIVLPYSCNYIF